MIDPELVVFFLTVFGFLGSIFWLIQLIDVIFRSTEFFESHTHQLVWFLVILISNLLGALWYFLWKRARKEAREIASLRAENEAIGNAIEEAFALQAAANHAGS